VRYPFLALLAAGPAHGYELKQALERRFGSVLPPLNAGQVYTTLARLERDGLVRGGEVEDDTRGKRVYEITASGREALSEWIEKPTPGPRLKDEFFTKLVLAGLTGLSDPKTLIDRQRREYLQSLRDLELASAAAASNGSPAGRLLIEGAALHLQADVAWLDICERQLVTKEAIDDSGSRS
jgi:DNA-binding PadR family transcriptional regulator